mmetsp:Transcript_13021/g.42421  ORF Transcript_13021/g.42421 Transcript_13021/m.42421 type:complete len:620 (-) Transcript_13021:80-1939(-)
MGGAWSWCFGAASPREALFGETAAEDRSLLERLYGSGQQRFFNGWEDVEPHERRRAAAALRRLHASYAAPDGLFDYLRRARALLDGGPNRDSVVGPPENVVRSASEEESSVIELGLETLGRCAFVLVAGGLGERLGFNGIKLALSTETATRRSFLELYFAFIKAWIGDDKEPAVAIMTSDDTHAPTVALLEANDYFGLRSADVHFLKQQKVPAFVDDGDFDGGGGSKKKITLARKGGSSVEPLAKPHGHGDVHSLLFRSGLPKRWLKTKKYVVFFQDTNALAPLAMPALLGHAEREGFQMATVAVPRTSGQESGALAKVRVVEEEEKRILPCANVEYNLLKAATEGGGSDPGILREAPKGEPSRFPANTNCFCVDLQTYATTLEATRGEMPEFVNPKYKEDGTFAKPARLECMMQDFPKLLPRDAKVGAVLFDEAVAYAPVKNGAEKAKQLLARNLPAHCPATGEAAVYRAHANLLKSIGCHVEEEKADPLFLSAEDVPAAVGGPHVVLHPSFATSVVDLRRKFTDPAKVRVSRRSTLLLTGPNVEIRHLDLDGALDVDASNPGSSILIRSLTCRNDGAGPVVRRDADDPNISIRGFSLDFLDRRSIKPKENQRSIIDE